MLNGLRQPIALKSIDPERFQDAILSMDKLLAAFEPATVPKADLVLIAGEPSKSRDKRMLHRGEKVPTHYRAGNDLQVVEIVLPERGTISLYKSLWAQDK